MRFVDDDGTVTYYATYTAYDGVGHRPAAARHRPTSVTFTSSPLLGAAAANKGLALFPRRIGGRFVALSRHDGETNAVACSDDIRRWPTATPLDVATAAWEAGPGRQLRITDRDSTTAGSCSPTASARCAPTRSARSSSTSTTRSVVIGQSRQPLLTPQPDEQDGYVPNVVYSCGSLRHGDLLLVPFGIADANIGFATFSIDDILAAMDAPAPRRPRHNTERRTDA